MDPNNVQSKDYSARGAANVNGASTFQTPPIPADQLALIHSAPKTKESLLKPIISSVLVIVLVIAGFFTYKSMSGYGTKIIEAEGFSYSIFFDKRATRSVIDGKVYLNGKDRVTSKPMVVSVNRAITTKTDCYETGLISIVSKPEIDGEAHNLCYSKTANTYAMNFTYNDYWYALAIFPKTKTDILDEATAKSIASSIKIN